MNNFKLKTESLSINEKILNFLSTTYEKSIVDQINYYNKQDKEINFENFFLKLKHNDWSEIYERFPVLKKNIPIHKNNFVRFIKEVENSFHVSSETLFNAKLISDSDILIKDIEVGEGDFHNGSSTSIVRLEDNNKLVYKPTNGKVSYPYFRFLDWIDNYFSLGSYRYKIINKDRYHWQEFVKKNSCCSNDELTKYYKRAGYTLCILYVLNSTDFHAENLIAKGDSLVLIDHETIIQPQIRNNIKEYFTQFDEESIADTILNTSLIPFANGGKKYPKGICGLGYSKNTRSVVYKQLGKDRFSREWKIETKLIEANYIKKNIPTLNDTEIFIDNYLDEFILGFEECYKLLLSQKDFLLGKDSPLLDFENTPIRFIWRPTNVYSKIINYLNLPKNLKSLNTYNEILNNRLSFAFKKVPINSDLNLILKHEIFQLSKGDIPYFEVNSSSRDLKTEFGTVKNFFELSAVENIKRKLEKLSLEDMIYQKNVILEHTK